MPVLLVVVLVLLVLVLLVLVLLQVLLQVLVLVAMVVLLLRLAVSLPDLGPVLHHHWQLFLVSLFSKQTNGLYLE